MKQIKTKLIALSLVCAFSAALTGCNNDSKDSGTVVVTNEPDSDSDNSFGENNASITIPEKDNDGSQISVVEVTDEDKKAVTNANGKPVTALAVVGDDGKIVTDAKGKNVAPNIPAAKETKKQEQNETEKDNKTTSKNTADAAIDVKTSSDGPTLSIANDIEAKAGEEVTFKVNITNNTGYTSLIAWLDINTKYFDIVSCEGGDTSSSNFERSPEYNNTTFNEKTKAGTQNTTTIYCMYFDSSCKTLSGDTTYATITLKVKSDTPAGKYDLAFDEKTDGNAKCNNVDDAKNIIVLTPKYKSGSITVK